MDTIELTIPLKSTDLDLSTEGELKLDRVARIAAMTLGYNSVRHFEIAAKQALINLAKESKKRAVKQTPAPSHAS